MTISNEIYQFVGTIKTETITYEIDAHVKRWHHLQHVVCKVWGNLFFQLAHVALHGIGARVGVGLVLSSFVHVSTIHGFEVQNETLWHFDQLSTGGWPECYLVSQLSGNCASLASASAATIVQTVSPLITFSAQMYSTESSTISRTSIACISSSVMVVSNRGEWVSVT